MYVICESEFFRHIEFRYSELLLYFFTKINYIEIIN